MAISVRVRGDVRIIELEGEFTLERGGLAHPLDLRGHAMPDLGGTLRSLLSEGCRKIVLDLGKVTFLDSSGLSELIVCRKRTLETGGDIVLLRPTGRVRGLLETLGLRRVFTIKDDESEALASFNR